jgi:hemoglobin
MVLGGPVKYTVRSAHAKLVENGLDDSHFDHVVAHLRETLEELKVPAEEIEAVISITESTRDDVLGRDPG